MFLDLTVMENILLAIQSTKPYRFGMFRPQKGHRDLVEKALFHLNNWGLREICFALVLDEVFRISTQIKTRDRCAYRNRQSRATIDAHPSPTFFCGKKTQGHPGDPAMQFISLSSDQVSEMTIPSDLRRKPEVASHSSLASPAGRYKVPILEFSP